MADMNPFERLAANRNRGRTYARSATSSGAGSDQPYKSDEPRHTVQVATLLRSHDPRFSVDPSEISVAQSRRKSMSQSPPRRRNPLALLASASTRDLSAEATVWEILKKKIQRERTIQNLCSHKLVVHKFDNAANWIPSKVGESRRHALPIPSSGSNMHSLPPPSPSSPRSRSAQSTIARSATMGSHRSSIAPRRLRRAATDSNSEIGSSSVAGSSAVSHHGLAETPEKNDRPAPSLTGVSKMLSAAEARDSKYKFKFFCFKRY
jgi:hypothetical protein